MTKLLNQRWRDILVITQLVIGVVALLVSLKFKSVIFFGQGILAVSFFLLTWLLSETWRKRKRLMKPESKKKNLRRLVLLSIGIVVCVVILGCSIVIAPRYRKIEKPSEVTQLIPPRSLIVVAKHKTTVVNQVISEPVDYYQLFKKVDTMYQFVKSINMEKSGVVSIENLDSGIYKIVLTFSGIEIVSRDNISIQEDQGIVLGLIATQPTGCFTSSVFCKDSITPLPDAQIEIQTPDGITVRETSTNNRGKTKEKLWLWPTLNETESYRAVVIYDGECVGELLDLRFDFQKLGEIKHFDIFTSVSEQSLER